MAEPRNLHEAMLTTTAGKHAYTISELLYGHGGAIKELPTGIRDGDGYVDYHTLLCRARDYLEELARAELDEQVPEWVREHLKRAEVSDG